MKLCLVCRCNRENIFDKISNGTKLVAVVVLWQCKSLLPNHLKERSSVWYDVKTSR